MGQKLHANCAAGFITARRKDNVAPDGVSLCIYRVRGLSSTRIGVYAHAAEVVTKARLHEAARLRIK